MWKAPALTGRTRPPKIFYDNGGTGRRQISRSPNPSTAPDRQPVLRHLHRNMEYWQDRQIGTLSSDGVATIDTLDNLGETTMSRPTRGPRGILPPARSSPPPPPCSAARPSTAMTPRAGCMSPTITSCPAALSATTWPPRPGTTRGATWRPRRPAAARSRNRSTTAWATSSCPAPAPTPPGPRLCGRHQRQQQRHRG